MAANPSSSEREIARRAALLMQTRDAGGKTPLMQACISGDIEAAKLLLDQGAEVNGKDFQGFTSLMLAANAGNLALATLLLEHKASVTVKTPQGFTPLLFAVAKKHPELVKLLIQHESNVNIRIKGMSALMIAASGGALEIVDSLLKAGADAAETNHKGMNAAAIASAQNRDDVAQLITDFLATQNPAKGRR
ncbi:MAG TPA: hypothetical protein DCS07_03555 [Bdellovibrionales bacterium]|nr:hypothetical protein [Bdellovibrionales bacterium]